MTQNYSCHYSLHYVVKQTETIENAAEEAKDQIIIDSKHDEGAK